MTDDPKDDRPDAEAPPGREAGEAPRAVAPDPSTGGGDARRPGTPTEGAGTLPPPPDHAAQRPTPESQAALTGKAPSSNSSAGTTMPASSSSGETPEEKKASLERAVAEAKAKREAAAGTETAGATDATDANDATEATRREPPGGQSPAFADPTANPTQAERERAAKVAEAKARAAALKEAAAGKTPPSPAAPAAATPAGAAGAPKPPVKKKEEGPKPADASGHPLVARLRALFAEAVLEATTFINQLSVRVAPASIVEVCRALRDDPETPFDFLSDLTCVHWPGREGGEFEVVYNLYSLRANERVRLKVWAEPEVGAGVAAEVESVTGVWPAANWMEREVFDLFGVGFRGHPDLRRLLLPADWQGHPLRKDYPLEAVENDWTVRHLPEFTEVQREQLEQRRAYGLELLSTPDERRIREIFRDGREPMPLDRK